MPRQRYAHGQYTWCRSQEKSSMYFIRKILYPSEDIPLSAPLETHAVYIRIKWEVFRTAFLDNLEAQVTSGGKANRHFFSVPRTVTTPSPEDAEA